jgi:hypothetical protein
MFAGWDNYFVLIGTASGGLIGLLFVVVTLTQGFERNQAARGQALYFTPTMVHFAVTLSVTALALIPRLPGPAFAALAAGGLALGLLNAVRASWGISHPRQGLPSPHWTDFWLYGFVPTVLYVAGLGLCWLVVRGPAWAAPSLASLLLVLLLVGIRNAWDLVTTIAPIAGTGGGGASSSQL